jgi:hypothetical protein
MPGPPPDPAHPPRDTPRGGLAVAHPLRAALLGLVRERGTLTSTEAARLTGESSGLCSFHLRQLARYGYLEEAPHTGGRVRPWQLPVPPGHDGRSADSGSHEGGSDDGFGALARDLEDEGYRRWLAGRSQAPLAWQHDEVFSTVLDLSPAELAEAAGEIRAVLGRYRGRAGSGRRPVAAVIRLFPLLPAGPGS